MKIFVLTQEDNFVIPQNVEKVIKSNGMNVIAISTIHSKSSLISKKTYFMKGFGIFQTIKMGGLYLFLKIYNLLDLLTNTRLFRKRKSLKAVAKHFNIPFLVTNNPNSKEFIEKIKRYNPDILLSFSAPVVFKDELLNLAPKGSINLHCSYLPHFAGLMPSFWVLYKGAKSAGATVHYMDSKIDNGSILDQIEIPYDKGCSMFALINKTKSIGGDLTCKVLKEIKENVIIPMPNKIDEGSYYSWPSIQQMKEFRRNGGRLI